MEQNISYDAVQYNMLGGHQEVLVCALIVDIAYTENRFIKLFLQILYFPKGISCWSAYPTVPIGAKPNPFQLVKNFIEIWFPKSRRDQSHEYEEITGLHDSSESLNFRKIFLQTF